MDQLQSHIRFTASSYVTKYLRIPLYIKKPFLIYDCATAPPWTSFYIRENFILFFISADSGKDESTGSYKSRGKLRTLRRTYRRRDFEQK
jgi:hypothetical protein